MANLYIMSGLPGSGKSTYALELSKGKGIILSTDSIRETLTGSTTNLSKDKDVWRVVYDTLDNRLEGYDYIVDATNLSTKRRRTYLRYKSKFDKIILVYMDVPISVAKERNAHRDRVVPDKAIDSMQKIKLQSENDMTNLGFDDIIVMKGE